MEPVLYMSQSVFTTLMYVTMAGLGATVVGLLAILIKEFKNNTLW